MEESILYWGYLYYKDWKIHLVVSPKGLCHVLWPNSSFDQLEIWTKKHFPNWSLIKDQDKVDPYVGELEEYFKGKRKVFDLPLDLRGTDFQVDVWKALLDIDYGETKSYLEIAEAINNPKAVRAVGGAIGSNPVSIIVPCHRVIGKNKKLTGFGGGLDKKIELLRIEGITDYKR